MEEREGTPIIGESARSLGARRYKDTPVDDAGLVRPGLGGMSVSPDDPLNLPTHRLPPEFGGTGKDPVWAINEYNLGEKLSYRPDPDNPTHGFVEPAGVMSFDDYQQAIHETQDQWNRVGVD